MEAILSWYHQQLETFKFYRLGLMAFILMVQANIILPVTILVIAMNNGSMFEFITCTAFSFGLLVSLIGGSPPKITIPLFAASTVVHLSIICLNVI